MLKIKRRKIAEGRHFACRFLRAGGIAAFCDRKLRLAREHPRIRERDGRIPAECVPLLKAVHTIEQRPRPNGAGRNAKAEAGRVRVEVLDAAQRRRFQPFDGLCGEIELRHAHLP